MNGDLYRTHLLMAYALARALVDLPLQEMLNAIGHAHAIGPILDPTLYRDKMHAMEQDTAVLRALNSAVSALPDSLREKLRQPAASQEGET